jgi:hypothetical protein
MSMRCAVETFCPAGNCIYAVEYQTLDAAREAYEAEVAAMPEPFTALRWAGQLVARTKPLADLEVRTLERSMHATLHGREKGFGLPWSHPEAARAWGSMPEERRSGSGRRRRW